MFSKKLVAQLYFMFVSDILFAIFEFLPFDSLLIASLVSHAFQHIQRQALQHRLQLRHGNTLPQRSLQFREAMGKIDGFANPSSSFNSFLACLELYLEEFAVDTGSSSIALPGLSVSNPLEELPFRGGSHFSEDSSTPVQWRLHHRYPALKVGKHVGRVDVGVGDYGAGKVVGICIVVLSEMGSLVRLSIAVSFQPSSPRVEWDVDVDPSCVVYLPSAHGVDGRDRAHSADHILSSHPSAFTHLRHATTSAHNENERIPLSSLTPIVLTVFANEPHCSVQRLLTLSASAFDRDLFMQCVEKDFFQLLKLAALEVSKKSVYQCDEVIEQLTTPKGVWSYPSGTARCVSVDVVQLLEKRRVIWLQQVRRNWDRSLRDLIHWWAPLGILVTFC